MRVDAYKCDKCGDILYKRHPEDTHRKCSCGNLKLSRPGKNKKISLYLPDTCPSMLKRDFLSSKKEYGYMNHKAVKV